jgi:dihydrodipicolinate synthase/N-acetylneuraminate lyase
MPDFHGVLPALITPFTEDGADVDADALAAIVDRLVGAGVAGVGDATGPVRAPLLALDDHASAELGGLLERAQASLVTA